MDRLNQIRILEKEINFHSKEIETNKHLAEVRISKNNIITIVFTIVSIIRNYVVRIFFVFFKKYHK